MRSTTKLDMSQDGDAKRRPPDPTGPDLQTVLFTVSMSLVGVMLAIQATDALGRSLAWASIVGYLTLGATAKTCVRRKLQGDPVPDRIWTVVLCVASICEFAAMMVVWGVSGWHR